MTTAEQGQVCCAALGRALLDMSRRVGALHTPTAAACDGENRPLLLPHFDAYFTLHPYAFVAGTPTGWPALTASIAAAT
jgi:hypothetical protein